MYYCNSEHNALEYAGPCIVTRPAINRRNRLRMRNINKSGDFTLIAGYAADGQLIVDRPNLQFSAGEAVITGNAVPNTLDAT